LRGSDLPTVDASVPAMRDMPSLHRIATGLQRRDAEKL
jgi:hypothetical protein